MCQTLKKNINREIPQLDPLKKKNSQSAVTQRNTSLNNANCYMEVTLARGD